MKKVSLRLACVLAALVLVLCGCGKDSSESNAFNSAPIGEAGYSTDATGNASNAFSHSDAVAAGFGMGTDTADDIKVRLADKYGCQPLDFQSNEYPSMTVSTLKYSFGVFEFRSYDSSAPVLVYADITSTLPAPCGATIGAPIADVAELVCAGSKDALEQNTEQELFFYGGDGSLPRGRYFMLTAEFTSSTTPELYALEYCDNAYEEGHFTRCTFYFGEQSTLLRFNLRYE